MIIFVTDELPRPGAAGHLAFNFAIISWLRAEGHDVTILLTSMRVAKLFERFELAHVAGPHVWRIAAYTAATPRTAARMLFRRLLHYLPTPLAGRLRRVWHRADAVLGQYIDPPDARWCARAIGRMRPMAVLVDTIFRAPLLAEPALRGINTILITHDLFHHRAEALEAAGYQVQPAGLTRHRETHLLQRAAHIAAIQPQEAKVLREMCPRTDVFVAPMPALPCPPPPGTERTARRLVFVGSDSLPNLDGLRWFFAKIWPALRGHDVTLDLIGDCGPALRRVPPEVHLLGRVPDLAPPLHRAALAISPLRAGSGLKIKLLDYARHGLFTIATPPSLQGFSIDTESPFIIAGSAGMFATAILRHMMRPPPPEAALAYVARHYGPETAFAGLRSALNSADCII